MNIEKHQYSIFLRKERRGNMSKYIELRVKKVYVVICCIVLLLIGGIGGYYIWCSYHPDIYIQISDGPTGKEGIKMEAPNISFAGHGIAQPASSIELNLQGIVSQHEFFCNYIKDTYKTSDIKLNIKVNDGQTILKYFGSATTLEDEVITIDEEFALDFTLDADIT